MAGAEDSAEKAYAAAAAEAKPKPEDQSAAAKPVETTAAADSSPAPLKPQAEAQTPVKPKPSAKGKPVAKKAAAKKPAAKTKSAPKPAAPKRAKASAAPKQPSVTELKDKIMATAKNDMTATMSAAVKEMQSKAKEAYDKSTEMTAEATEFAKGNVEALVESGKILSAGVQDIGKTYVEEAKSAYETMTADLKEMAAVKSPTELFQLQGKIMRRNFDAMVATGSKNTEAMMKLANDSFAPLSGRVSLAAEKMSKVA